jgi:hypothetical protein
VSFPYTSFKVMDSSVGFRSDVGDCACIRLDRLQQGYRCVDLLDPVTRQNSGGKLFVKIKKVPTSERDKELLKEMGVRW